MFKNAGALEDNVLTLLAFSDEHAALLALRLTPDMFSTRAYRAIATVTIDFIERYGKPPKVVHLRDMLENKINRGDDGRLISMTLDEMEKLAPHLQSSFVLDELDRFIATRQLSGAIDRASDALHDGDLAKARELLFASGKDDAGDKPGIYLHDPEAMLEFMTEREEDLFSTGIEELDRRGIRPERKTMMMMIAPPKRGKSWWLVNIGKAGITNRRSVLHITLENSTRVTSRRYVQALFAMTKKEVREIRVPILERDSAGRFVNVRFDTIDANALTPDKRVEVSRKLRMLRRRPPLMIKEYPMGTLTIAQLDLFLDYLARAHNFCPDLLIVDYPDLMAMNAERVRVETGLMFKGIRGIASKRNLAAVVVTQGNRASADSKTVRGTMVAEDFSKTATADIIITYSQTAAERQLGLARLLVDGSRNDSDKYVVLITQSYATGQFCIDSTYMNKHVEDEVNRVSGEGNGDDKHEE